MNIFYRLCYSPEKTRIICRFGEELVIKSPDILLRATLGQCWIPLSVLQRSYHYRSYVTPVAILICSRQGCSPAVTMLTVRLHYAAIPAGMTVRDSGKIPGCLGGTRGLEKLNCLQQSDDKLKHRENGSTCKTDIKAVASTSIQILS